MSDDKNITGNNDGKESIEEKIELENSTSRETNLNSNLRTSSSWTGSSSYVTGESSCTSGSGSGSGTVYSSYSSDEGANSANALSATTPVKLTKSTSFQEFMVENDREVNSCNLSASEHQTQLERLLAEDDDPDNDHERSRAQPAEFEAAEVTESKSTTALRATSKKNNLQTTQTNNDVKNPGVAKRSSVSSCSSSSSYSSESSAYSLNHNSSSQVVSASANNPQTGYTNMEQQQHRRSEFDKALTDVIHSGLGAPHKGGTPSYNNLTSTRLPPPPPPPPPLLLSKVDHDSMISVKFDEPGIIETSFSPSETEFYTSTARTNANSKNNSNMSHYDETQDDNFNPTTTTNIEQKQQRSRYSSTNMTPIPPSITTTTTPVTVTGSTPVQSVPTDNVPPPPPPLEFISRQIDSSRPPQILSSSVMGEQQQQKEALSQTNLSPCMNTSPSNIHTNARSEWEEDEDEQARLKKEHLRRTIQQSMSGAPLISLAHKRYERRRVAANEIEKVVRSQVYNRNLDRVRTILLLLSDDFVKSTNEDARKGGVMALATCAIGLRKAHELEGDKDLKKKVDECKDLILASVVHACQDNSQRVRYYAMESLTNVIKVIPSLAVEHFFILFEILRSLWADVDTDVMNGAELLDKKLKEVIVGSINTGHFTADACVPLFARYVHLDNKPTKRLTLTWLQEFSDKLVGGPLLEFLHLFLCDIFIMLAEPNDLIRKESFDFLSSIQPKLLMNNLDFEDESAGHGKVDFDKILQNLVTTMEHPDPSVRNVAMQWVSRIVHAHLGDKKNENRSRKTITGSISAASISVRNSLPHVLPGILLSIGDAFGLRGQAKDITFLPHQTTHIIAEQTNKCLQNAVRNEGRAYIALLDGFIVALREELDTHSGIRHRRPTSSKRKPYRMDVKDDGTGIESSGWFRDIDDSGEEIKTDEHIEPSFSLLCALEWITILFEFVVPESLRDEYAEEFIIPIVRLLDNTPHHITFKSLEVLYKITLAITKTNEDDRSSFLPVSNSSSDLSHQSNRKQKAEEEYYVPRHPMTDANATFALGILSLEERQHFSRNRQVFTALVNAHAQNHDLLIQLPRIIRFMCTLQPPEFVFVSFGLELERFSFSSISMHKENTSLINTDLRCKNEERVSRDLDFSTKFVQILMNVLLTTKETKRLRETLKNCIAQKGRSVKDERKAQLFHILLNTFAHDVIAAVTSCIWSGAFKTAATYLHGIDPLDINLMFYLSLDQFIELLERPLFRDLHFRMLECDEDPVQESSGAMLYRFLKSVLMLLPQSTSCVLLQQRLVSLARFRQSAVHLHGMSNIEIRGTSAEVFVHRIFEVRKLHCDAKWRSIRSESLEPYLPKFGDVMVEESKRKWLGYENKNGETRTRLRDQEENISVKIGKDHNECNDYNGYRTFATDKDLDLDDNLDEESNEKISDTKQQWKDYWAEANDS